MHCLLPWYLACIEQHINDTLTDGLFMSMFNRAHRRSTTAVKRSVRDFRLSVGLVVRYLCMRGLLQPGLELRYAGGQWNKGVWINHVTILAAQHDKERAHLRPL